MKIDIQIHDATPEEVQRFLIGLQVNTLHYSRLAPIHKLGKKESNAKNAASPRWTEPEYAVVKAHLNDPDWHKAWKEYQEKFPGQRNEHSVYLKWYAYRIQGKKDKPEPEKKGAGIKSGNRYFNKWKIPYSHKDPEYEPARRLCKKHGKPYPEALALKEAADAAERQKKPEKVEKRTPAPKKKIDARKCNKGGAVIRWTPDEDKAIIDCKDKDDAIKAYRKLFRDSNRKGNGIRQRFLKLREKTVTASQLNSDKITMAPPPDGIITGINVRQIKPVDGKLFFGTGTVLVRDGDLVTIRNGKGKKYTLDVSKLEIATGPEKKAPEHGRFRDERNPEEMSSPGERPAPEVATKSPQSDPGPVPARHITRGDKVRHTVTHPLFPGIGTVVKTTINGNEVLVDYGSGTEWLDRKNLELMPVEAKT
jgi:hypothetical protein